MARGLVAMLVLAGLLAALPALAGVYESRFGYTLAYPESWEPVDPASLGAGSSGQAERELAGKLAEKVDLALMGPPVGGFTPNVIVVVAADRLEIGPETMSEQLDGLTKTLETAGGEYTVLEAAYTNVGAHKGIRIEGELLFSEGRPPVRNLIAIVPGHQYTYTLTCTASAKTYETLKPTFEQILEGLSVPMASERAQQPPPAVWTILALAVALLLVFSWVRLKRSGEKK